MNISFDYDKTITADRRTMENVMDMFDAAGHNVYVVSGRLLQNSRELEYLKRLPYIQGVFLTDYQGKRRWAEQNGIEIDVWVDDNPESILFDLDKETYEMKNQHTQPVKL